MATLNIGPGQQYSTIADAVNAASGGDTISVQAGTYKEDSIQVGKSLEFEAAGGQVIVQPANGQIAGDKGLFVVGDGSSAPNATFNGFAFENTAGPSGNDAGIRVESGNVTVDNSLFQNDQMGLLATPLQPGTGSVSISASEFTGNGAPADGSLNHSLYVNETRSLTVDGSYFHGDQSEGETIKSRADNTTVTNTRVDDRGTPANYEIGISNGGNATISGDTLVKGADAANHTMIAFGAEGDRSPPNDSLTVNGNTLIDEGSNGTAVWNATSAIAKITNDSLYGITTVSNGPASQSGNVFISSEPTMDTTSPWQAAVNNLSSQPAPSVGSSTPAGGGSSSGGSTPGPTPAPVSAPPHFGSGGGAFHTPVSYSSGFHHTHVFS